MPTRKLTKKQLACIGCKCEIPVSFAEAGFIACSAACFSAFEAKYPNAHHSREDFLRYPNRYYCAYCGQVIRDPSKSTCQEGCWRRLRGAFSSDAIVIRSGEPDSSLADILPRMWKSVVDKLGDTDPAAAADLRQRFKFASPSPNDPKAEGRESKPHDLMGYARMQGLLRSFGSRLFPEDCWRLRYASNVMPEQEFWDRLDIVEGRFTWR